MNAKIRKMQINLSTVGTGVVLFGLWTVIKFALTYFVLGNEDLGIIDDEQSFWVNAVIMAVILIGFSIRCYIGLSARSESKGKRKSVVYLVFTGIMIFFYILILAVEIIGAFFSAEYFFNIIISLIIDGTSTAFFVELMIYSIGLRRLKKQDQLNGGSQ